MNNNPLVSIACLTYNHEKYIRDAINGFLIQKTDFQIEIIIHDDASTDNTANIIREYEKKYPELIKPIYQNENKYSKGIKPSPNYVWPKCSGKYIALCEGDDYWLDPFKLQKQVNFLEVNNDFMLCFTNARVIDKEGNIERNYLSGGCIEQTYTHLDMPISAPTQTVLFRNSEIRSIPKSFQSALGGDTYLLVWLSKFGKIKYHNYVSAVYRDTGMGTWTSRSNFQKERHLFQTYYAILDIAEKNAKEGFIYRIFIRLVVMKKYASTNSDKLLILDLYNQISDYLKIEKNSGRVSSSSYFRYKIILKFYFYIYSQFVQLKLKFLNL